MRRFAILAGVVFVMGLVVAACGNIQTMQPAAGQGLAKTITIKMTDKAFDPNILTLQGGIPTTLVVQNLGSKPHTFRVDAFQGNQDVRLEIAPGKSDQVILTGTYVQHLKYYSDLPGDEEAGLAGLLNVKTIW